MGKKEPGTKPGFLERTADFFDLPAEIAGLPRIELVGRHVLRMESHRGILSYGTEEILISGGSGGERRQIIYRVRGTELELKAMNGEELLIQGNLLSVELE